MSENQSDCFFSMLEHAIVPVRATKFAEVETDLHFGPETTESIQLLRLESAKIFLTCILFF